MTAKTSKGFEFAPQWMATSLSYPGDLMFDLEDDRPLYEIAKEFENCSWIKRYSEEEGDVLYEDYTEVVNISRPDLFNISLVSVTIRKPFK